METCLTCHGSGESGQYAVLDCTAPGCTAAFDRAEFNAYMAALAPMTQYDRDWAAYRYGWLKMIEQVGQSSAVLNLTNKGH